MVAIIPVDRRRAKLEERKYKAKVQGGQCLKF